MGLHEWLKQKRLKKAKERGFKFIHSFISKVGDGQLIESPVDDRTPAAQALDTLRRQLATVQSARRRRKLEVRIKWWEGMFE